MGLLTQYFFVFWIVNFIQFSYWVATFAKLSFACVERSFRRLLCSVIGACNFPAYVSLYRDLFASIGKSSNIVTFWDEWIKNSAVSLVKAAFWKSFAAFRRQGSLLSDFLMHTISWSNFEIGFSADCLQMSEYQKFSLCFRIYWVSVSFSPLEIFRPGTFFTSDS